jgi:hypothetical protein
MTGISDGIRIGNYQLSSTFEFGGLVPTHGLRYRNIVPLTLQNAGLVASVTPNGGYLTLFAGTGVTRVAIGGTGTFGYKLDVPRNVTVTGVTSTTSVNFTVYGYDEFNNPMVEQIVGPTGATTAKGNKAFSIVTYIKSSGNTTQPITVGFGDVIGLPIRLNSKNYVVVSAWNEAALALTAYTVADGTSPATLSTGDVRGTVTLPGGTPSDGAKRLTVGIYPAGAIGSGQTLEGVRGVLQYTQALA